MRYRRNVPGRLRLPPTRRLRRLLLRRGLLVRRLPSRLLLLPLHLLLRIRIPTLRRLRVHPLPGLLHRQRLLHRRRIPLLPLLPRPIRPLRPVRLLPTGRLRRQVRRRLPLRLLHPRRTRRRLRRPVRRLLRRLARRRGCLPRGLVPGRLRLRCAVRRARTRLLKSDLRSRLPDRSVRRSRGGFYSCGGVWARRWRR